MKNSLDSKIKVYPSLIITVEKSKTFENIRTFIICTINIFSSISMIFINKYIFINYNIRTITLTTIHMITTFLALYICAKLKTFIPKTVSIIKILPLAFSFCGFVVFTNLSLSYNTIGTYQSFKVLTTPVVVIISRQMYKVKYSSRVLLTLIPVTIGVCAYSINDVRLTLMGTLLASIGVLSASFYQVLIGDRIKSLAMTSEQLLYHQAPLSVVLLIPLIILFESNAFNLSVEKERNALLVAFMSGIIAFIVDLSIYRVIEVTSVLTYNMIGHMKTVSIIVGGLIIFNESINFQQSVGITITILSLLSYTLIRMQE